MTPLALALHYAGAVGTGARHHPHFRAMSRDEKAELFGHVDRLESERDARRKARNRRKAAR